MNKRGSYGSMADRVAASRHEESSRVEPPSIRHCWVTSAHGRLPGLLLEWRRTADGVWRGRVIHPIQQDAGWAVVEEWIEAALLDPV